MREMALNFNSFIGCCAEALMDFSGSPDLAPSKGMFPNFQRVTTKALICYNFKAIAYNAVTVVGIVAFAMAFFGTINPATALTLTCLSLAGRLFLQEAVRNSALGASMEIARNLRRNPIDQFFMRTTLTHNL